MESSEAGAVSVAMEESLPTYSIDVLHLIKTAQKQHGGKYSDYQRYRRYCFSRLRRLYKSLKFLHGRGKYHKKVIEPSIVSDVRFLHIPLFSAERAWAYAMELKQVEGGPDLSRKRTHLIRRLTKAAKWGDLFSHLCSQKADSKTALEAEAYASYMWGNVLLERETNWEAALRKFVRARNVYEQLGKVGELQHQIVFRQRVEELEPSIRYCKYKLGDSTSGVESTFRGLGKDNESDSLAQDLLASKLQAVMEEALSHDTATLTALSWLGQSVPIHNSKTRVAILRCKELEAELDSGIPLERQLGLFDKLLMSYQDAKRQIQQDKVAAGGADDMKEELDMLERAVSGLLLQRTVHRNLLLVEEHRSRAARAQDLVRLYDILLQNMADLIDVTVRGRDSQPGTSAFLSYLAVRQASFKAARCFYLAQSFASAAKYAEAYVLFGLAAGESAAARRNQLQLDDSAKVKLPGGEEPDLELLGAKCRSQRCLLHAQAVRESASSATLLQQGVARLSMESRAAPAAGQAEALYLLDCLDEYKSVVEAPPHKVQAPRVVLIPPPFQAVPCRPIVMDTALNAIQFPSVASRTKQEMKKSSLFNFWRS